MKEWRRPWLFAASIVLLFSTHARAQNAPAVSGANGKIDIRGVNADGNFGGHSVASLTLPFAQYFGVQLDGLAGTMNGAYSAAIAGHAFWRNPTLGLVGFYGSYGYDARLGGATIGHVAGEFELYFGRLTGTSLIGYQFGDAGTGLTVKAELNLYLVDDFKLYGGYIRQPNISDRGIAGAELMLRDTNFSVFSEGRRGKDNWTAMAGIRFYSGHSQTLIDRHRKDDPPDHFSLFVDAAAGYYSAKSEIVDADMDGSPSSVDCDDNDPFVQECNPFP